LRRQLDHGLIVNIQRMRRWPNVYARLMHWPSSMRARKSQ